jgi:hypothetical protein
MSRVGWTPAPKPKNRHGIGGNGAPAYDPDAPVTGFPMVLRDIEAFSTQDGTEITSRSKLREYCSKNQVEQCGLENTAESDRGGKSHHHDAYKAHRRERERAVKRGTAQPPKFTLPPKPKKKEYPLIVGGSRGGYDKKTRQWSTGK